VDLLIFATLPAKKQLTVQYSTVQYSTDSTAHIQLNDRHNVIASKCYELWCKLKATTHSPYRALYCQLNQTDSTDDSQLNDRTTLTTS